MPSAIRERDAMLAAMNPVLLPGAYRFCTTTDAMLAERAVPMALAVFREEEGVTLVLREADADRLGFEAGPAMARIVLTVHSSLEGVGLTAAVATALADAGIPCNVVAAYHHDHVFVPAARGAEAVRQLAALQATAAGR